MENAIIRARQANIDLNLHKPIKDPTTPHTRSREQYGSLCKKLGTFTGTEGLPRPWDELMSVLWW
jgi:hypothetical protein